MEEQRREEELLIEFSRAQTPGEIWTLLQGLGFNGLLFQRWYPTCMDHWEVLPSDDFFDHYYVGQKYRHCQIAKVVHLWRRDFTFVEAREAFPSSDPHVAEAEALWKSAKMEDGFICLAGRPSIPCALAVTKASEVEPYYQKYANVVAYAVRRLDKLLPTGHELLGQMQRTDPEFSETQKKILQLQIDYPEESSAEIATRLGISPKTLISHQKKIAKKAGVTSFTGAVIQRLKEGNPG